jgi:excisionase family DNA binding protein
MSNLDDLLSSVDDDQLPAVLLVISARLLRRNGNGNGTHPEHTGNGRGLLTVDQAAAKLGVSRDWLYRHAPTLPYTVHLGRALRFSEAGIDRWIRQRSGR